MCWSQWNTLLFFIKFQFQWKLGPEKFGELEDFLKVHLEDYEDLFLSTYNYKKWTQDPWKPYTQCYKLIHWLHDKCEKKYLEHPGCAGIHFSTICDVTIESTWCNIEYKVFKSPKFIYDNYNLIGRDLHDLPDSHLGILPIHDQHPVSIGTETRWSF